MGLVRRVFRRSFEHVDAYAALWSASNEQALAAEGPLLVVLGDSAAQGVGASAYDRGWVGLVRNRLVARDGRAWRVVNLSRSGAKTRDVLDGQLRAAPEADLLVAVVGGNDALHTRAGHWLADARELVAALPPGAVVSTTARGVFERKTRRINDVIGAEAEARGLRVADVWAHTGPPYRGLYFDGLHPNDKGYRQWADAVWAALTAEHRPTS
ncbi:MAG: SGNH/GDSL hydrolase family protein [Actinobacteria bacterium]|nr:SGNH/GDSL hydrolase family protein [Actinomycetota bacterium]MCA1721279.1 SGNH/GDSL hydrolase family protein [Actinomycetota bacterium]